MVPSVFSSPRFPGIAKTCLPCSSAVRAVIIAPLLISASTTSVPWHMPLIMRFLTGKCSPAGGVPGGYSVTTAPFSAISCMSFACSRG